MKAVMESAGWVHQAAKLPIAFAQVREDPALDQAVLDEVNAGAKVIMIASGGCTVAALAATQRVDSIHFVDANPAQLALTRLKLRLLETCEPGERLALLGHAGMPGGKRARVLDAILRRLDLSAADLGPEELVYRLGPDHVGRYEFLFAEFRRRLVDVAAQLESLLQLHDPRQQSRHVEPHTPLRQALDDAFGRAFARHDIVHVFGRDATRNPRVPFPRHFARRTCRALSTLPANANPWLSQMLMGRFQDGLAYPWLHAAAPRDMCGISWSASTIQDALAAAPPDSFDVVHLSNITDWLAPPAAVQTLALAWRALKKDGIMILRQLNSKLDIPALGGRFCWERELAAKLHRRDRSFFYRAIHIGRKA